MDMAPKVSLESTEVVLERKEIALRRTNFVELPMGAVPLKFSPPKVDRPGRVLFLQSFAVVLGGFLLLGAMGWYSSLAPRAPHVSADIAWHGIHKLMGETLESPSWNELKVTP